MTFLFLNCTKSTNFTALALFCSIFACYLDNYTPPAHSKNKVKIDHNSKTNEKNTPQRLNTNTLLLKSGDIKSNPGPQVPTADLCVIHLNARSFRNDKDLVTAQTVGVDILTVSETWFSPTLSQDDVFLNGFHLPVRRDRPNDAAYGGVAIYVRNHLYCKARPDLSIAGLEAVWIETKLNQESILICSIYRPSSSKVNYWKLIGESINQANDTGLNFFILGDLNIDWHSAPSQHLLNIIHLYQLHQLVKEPTRVTNTTSTCLDLILTQSPQLVTHCEVLPEICSDHRVPCIYILNSLRKIKSIKRTIYNYSQIDCEKLNAALNIVDWNDICTYDTLDESVQAFTERFIQIAKECMPVKTVSINPKDAPWINDELRMLVKERNRRFKTAKRTNRVTDWERFRQLRNQLTTKIRERKLEYINEIDTKASDPTLFGKKDWWRLVKSFMNKKGMETEEIPPLELNGNTYHSNLDKATVFNNFFSAQSTLENNDDETPNLAQSQGPILQNITLTATEVKTIINELDKNKAVGPDLIHNKLLFAAKNSITEPLTYIFNRCLTESKFPTIWKTAHVNPIHKKGEKNVCNNYRPISLLSCVGKLFERCIHSHVYNFLRNNNIITPSQSGFIPGDSTTNQLLSIYNSMCQNIDKKIKNQAVFLDISKAFDRVWHKGLLCKLQSVGIRGNLLNWFKDYLSNRKQATVVKGQISEYLEIHAGVPQGSVLGPLLFLVYINDITQEIESDIKLFADDTSLSFAANNHDTRTDTLNNDLKRILEWGKKWKVVFNEGKTNLLNFSNSYSQNHQLLFGNTILADSTSHKHLGVTFQNDGKWDEHIRIISSKIKMLVSCLKSYKYRLNRKSLETLYKSYILPHFDYADIIYDNCTDALAEMLEQLQLEALRIISGSVRGTSHNKLYSETGFCTLKERRKRHKLIAYKKIVLGHCPNYLNDLLPDLVSNTNPYSRRRPLERRVPTFKTKLYSESFFPSTTRLYNTLPNKINETDSIGEFKHHLTQEDTTVPPYYYDGTRMEQIIHCRLRLQMSDLNDDLVNRHLQLHSFCSCGHRKENAEHYLLHCPNYNDIRTNTIHTLPPCNTNINTLLFGNPTLSLQSNANVFAEVQKFIKRTQRFY